MINQIEMSTLTPKATVEELDKYIIGQDKAKKAVSIALRNRLRRRMVPEDIRDEIAPKNIIMIGPTGVGKTEIARRIAKLCHAPFVKVEATKYTEVGYVGRDVESIIRDLVNVSINLVKSEMKESVIEEAEKRTEEVILNLLLPKSEKISDGDTTETTREKFAQMLKEGKLDERIVEISVQSNSSPVLEMFSGSGIEGMGINLTDLGNMFGGGKQKKKKVTIAQAQKIVLEQEIEKLLDMDRVTDLAIEKTENDGIVFVDEIDKVAVKSRSSNNAEVSREGVQRDLLPIVEGCQVNTKYGPVKTDHILFIAAGAFHMSKPSDLIPELQGRFPIRVELDSLKKEDFIKILSQPKNALIKQYEELLKTEEVKLVIKSDALETVAEFAYNVNSETENIGARRLHTIMEKLLEDISFKAPDMKGETVEITADFVKDTLSGIVENRDLSKYIL